MQQMFLVFFSWNATDPLEGGDGVFFFFAHKAHRKFLTVLLFLVLRNLSSPWLHRCWGRMLFQQGTEPRCFAS